MTNSAQGVQRARVKSETTGSNKKYHKCPKCPREWETERRAGKCCKPAKEYGRVVS